MLIANYCTLPLPSQYFRSSTSPDSHVRVLTKLDSTVEKCAEVCGQDFLLPYDLWWEFKFLTQDQNRNPSTQYRKIRTSKYISYTLNLPFTRTILCTMNLLNM